MGLKAEVAKNNMIFTAGNVAAAALSFVFSVAVARMLGPEQFGLFSFVLVVMGFFTVFIDLGISSTLIKFISESIEKSNGNNVRTLIRFFFKFRIALTLIVASVMVIFSEPISSALFGKQGHGIFIEIAAGVLAANSILDFANMCLLAFKSFAAISILKVIERTLRIAIVVLFIAFGFGAIGASGGVMIGLTLTALIGMVLLKLKDNTLPFGSEQKVSKKGVINFGFWVFIGSVLSSIFIMTDTLLISIMRTVQEVGFYSISVSWMTLVAYLVPISSIVMYPYFSRLDAAKNFKALHTSIRYALILAMPLASLLSAFSLPIIITFYGQSFSGASLALSVLSFVSVMLIINPILMGYFYGISKPKLYACIALILFILNVALNYTMICAFGIWGAAAATLLSRLVEFAALTSVISFSMKLGFEWKNLAKPVIVSAIIYAIAIGVPAPDILGVIFYGVLLMAAYIAMMVAIKGVKRSEITWSIRWMRSKLFGI